MISPRYLSPSNYKYSFSSCIFYLFTSLVIFSSLVELLDWIGLMAWIGFRNYGLREFELLVKLYGEEVFWSLTVCFEVLHCFAAFLLLAPHCGRFLILSLWWQWYSEAVRIESHCDRWYSLIVISCCTWQRLQRRLWLVVSSVGFNTGCTDSSNITSRLGGEWMQNSRQKVCTLIPWYILD